MADRTSPRLTDSEREMRSGWIRTTVTTFVGVMALSTATYTVVSKIAAAELLIKDSQERLEKLEIRVSDFVQTHEFNNIKSRVYKLEENSLPAGIERGKLTALFNNLQNSLDKIDRRLERLENKSQ